MNNQILNAATRAIEFTNDQELMVTLAHAAWTDKFLTKFAQNIVQDCLAECDQEYDAANAARAIREKFGVK